MALFAPKTVLQAAQGGAQTKRYRDFVVAHFEGEGAIAVPNAIWLPAAAWANARQPSGNRMRDRGMLLQRLDVLVTRRGTTVVSTTGGMIPLARLRNAMRAEGVDLKEWNFPPDNVLDKALDPGVNKKEAGDAAPEDAAPAPEDQGPGVLTRIDAQTVRSSTGFEVRIADQYTSEYTQGPLKVSIRGVPGMVGGRQGFKVKLDALLASEPLLPSDQARVLANFRAAMELLNISVML
ncbi:MAG: hypothetical protein JWR07_2616 [Nevskia sp.]|nr:hypothetical protein [Nevskia sp.]